MLAASNSTIKKNINPDVAGHATVSTHFSHGWVIQLSIHAEEVNQSQAVLKALSLCVKRKGKRFQRFSAPECRSRSSGITLKDPELTDLTVTLGCTLVSLNMGAM